MQLVKTSFQDLSRITLTTRADRVSETITSQPWKKQDVFVETAKCRLGEKGCKKKKFLESSRLQFRNNSRYNVTPALKWKPSTRSSRRRRCYYSAKVKIIPVVCGAASLPHGRNASKFLSRAQKYVCPRCFAKRFDLIFAHFRRTISTVSFRLLCERNVNVVLASWKNIWVIAHSLDVDIPK